MLHNFKNRSLYHQLIIPIFVVGIVGLLALTYSASQLNSAVTALGDAFTHTDERLRNIESIEISLIDIRALSLRHLASESFSSMSEIKDKFNDTKALITGRLSLLLSSKDEQHEHYNLRLQQLQTTSLEYIGEIEDIIRTSEEFEKELAFSMMTKAEGTHLSVINAMLHELKRHAFMDISQFRDNLTTDAERNMTATTLVGIICLSLFFFIAFLVTRRITLRIAHLLTWSRQVSSGNLSAPLVADSDDEVGRLTLSMKQMATSIRQAHHELDMAKVTAEKAADELQLYGNAFDNSGEAMLVTDINNHIINVNSAFETQTGYRRDEVLGKDPKMFSSGRTAPEVYQEMWNELKQNGFWQGELWDKKKNGAIYPKWIRISSIRDEHAAPLFFIASFTDISERKESEARIEHLAHHDILTGLHNRFSMEERLEQAMLTAHRAGSKLALLFIDLDRFKAINDSLGHHAGDQLLIEVALRLKNCLRESDIVARIGGDEFVIVLPDIGDNSRAAIVAESVLSEVSRPYDISDQAVTTSPSVGISIYPNDGESVDDLMRSADVAMYHAKENGRNNYHYFNDSMLVAANERITIERELRDAIVNSQLELYYQPQVDAADSNIVALEALVRWNHPKRGLISPDLFIGIAEESGIINELGNWVIQEAFRQLASWKETAQTQYKLALNLSARQLHSKTLTDEVHEMMIKHQVTGNELEFEVTETAAMSDPELAVRQLNALRDLGISLAIDDFGTGYSSLAYIKRLPIDILKLDRSFVRDIESDINDAEICSATVAMAHNLGLKVVAEGVETVAQRDYLVKLKCDYLQGYLFSKPLPASQAAKLLRSKRFE